MSTNNIISKPGIENQQSRISKRFLLKLGWGLINIASITAITVMVIGSGWEIPWLVLVMSYMSMYWILVEKLSDALIGENLGKRQAP